MDGPWTLIGKTAEINEWVNWHSCEKLSTVYSGPMVELIESCRTHRVGLQSRHSINRPITSVDPHGPIKQQWANIMSGPMDRTAKINEWANWHCWEELSIVYSGPMVELIKNC